jgi:hypothetical protein
MTEAQTMTIEDSFGRLKFEYERKMAEMRALESQRFASQQRLDQALKQEASAQVALRKVNGEFATASKNLSQAKRDARQAIADAEARRDRILAQAHDQARAFLEAVTTAIQAAASVIPKRQQENANETS